MKKQYIQAKCSIIRMEGDIIATSNFETNGLNHRVSGYNGESSFGSSSDAEAAGVDLVW